MKSTINRSRGFTLMELIIVVALAAVILGIGAPNFREFMRNSRMVSVANDFLGGIQTARTEAIKRQLPTGGVAICSSTDPDADEPECTGEGTTNFDGWIAFADANNNCERDDGEDVIRVGSRIDTNNTPTHHVNSASNGDCLSFAATGFLRTDNGRDPATRTVFCDERGNEKQDGLELSVARGLDVTITGRARVTRDVAEIEAWPVDCP
jgi:type IV fimbrial biogenesis protein FimT